MESEIHHLHKEDKNKGKQREVSASREWCEWEFTLDSDIAEKLLSKTSRKCQQDDIGALDMPYGGMIAFSNAKPKEIGPSMELLPVGSEQKALDTMVPIATSGPPLLWGKGVEQGPIVLTTFAGSSAYWSKLQLLSE